MPAYEAMTVTAEVLQADYNAAINRLVAHRETEPENWEIMAAMKTYRAWQDAVTIRQEVAFLQTGKWEPRHAP